MVDRLGQHCVPRKPLRRSAVQLRNELRLIAFQPAPEELGEQGVEPEPLPGLIDPGEEQVTELDLLEHGLSSRLAAQRGREIGADPFRQRDGEQEMQDLRFQHAQDVLGEEVTDGMVATGDVADQLAGMPGSAQRHACQLQRRDPTVGR